MKNKNIQNSIVNQSYIIMDINSAIYAIHIVFGLSWLVLAYYGLQHSKKIPDSFFSILVPLALAIMVYHGYKLVQNSLHGYYMRHWVYLVHIIVVAGILLYLGIKARDANPNIYYVIGVLGVGAVLYHSEKLVARGEVTVI